MHPQITTRQAVMFWSRVHKQPGSCWLWTGARNGQDYGSARAAGKTRRATHIMWALLTGEWPGDLIVCHSCDIPACVRPDHLWIGTQADNIHDMIVKGRGRREAAYYGHAPAAYGHAARPFPLAEALDWRPPYWVPARVGDRACPTCNGLVVGPPRQRYCDPSCRPSMMRARDMRAIYKAM